MAVDIQTTFSYPSGVNTLRVTDSTGDYDASSNPGGYGSPNIERTDYALYFVAYRKPFGESEIDLSIANAAPKTVESWDISLTTYGDGHYQFDLIHIPIWDNGTSYAVNQVVFDDADDALYIATGTTTPGDAPSATPGEWDTIADAGVTLATIADAPSTYGPTTSVLSNQFNEIVVINSNKCFASLVIGEAKDGCDGGCFEKDEEIRKFVIWLDAVAIYEARAQYTSAEKIVDALKDLCSEVNCS
jgi:hypothetical protein